MTAFNYEVWERGRFCRTALGLDCATMASKYPWSLQAIRQGAKPDPIQQARDFVDSHPDDVGGICTLGDALFFRGEIDSALDLYYRLLPLANDNFGVLQRILHCLDLQCDWAARRRIVEMLSEELIAEAEGRRPPSFEPASYLSCALEPSRMAKLLSIRAAAEADEARARVSPFVRPRRRTPKSIHRHLRLGYMSIDFRSHSAGISLKPLLSAHDREKIRLFGYCFAVEDEAIARDCAEIFEVYRNLSTPSWAAIAQQIVDDDLDILVDTTRHIRGSPAPLFSLRVAPIQVSAWGYGGTTGSEHADYLLADRYLVPHGEEDLFLEKIVRIPSYHPVSIPSHLAKGIERSSCQLPENSFVFACFVNHYKIDESIFQAWLKIIERIPDSVLWLYSGTSSSRRNLRSFAEGYGIDPSRVVFADRIPRDQHLTRFPLADLVLDNPNMGGAASVHEGLSMGVPCVSLAGNSPESRSGLSILSAMGLPDLVANDLEDYVNLAGSLASNSSRLSDVKQQIEKKRDESRLFDIRRFAEHLENSYHMMWDRHLSGEMPASFDLETPD